MPYRILTPPPPWLDLQTVEREADRFVRRRAVRLMFSRDLERLFNEERSGIRGRQLGRVGLFALIVFNMFLVSDYLLMPQELVRSAIVRLGIVTPLVLLSTLVLRHRRASAEVQEPVASVLCVLGCCAILYLHHGATATIAMQAEPGVLLVLLAMNTLIRPDFWVAIAATVSCYTVFLLFLVTEHGLVQSQQWSVGGRVFWFSVLSLAANYALSRDQRFSWLLQMRSRIQQKLLAEANRELLSLSLRDQLTGLPNRGAYTQQFDELWQQAIEHHEPIAAIMVDVDHFKAINDSFGHLYGDRVLQRVATLLCQAMRAEGDFVARFGGEEFVVLLPGSTLEQGAQVAERIRMLVQVAGSPAVARGDAPLPADVKWSTVSCGVASMTPTSKDYAPGLIHAADAALYRAKQAGRNRVCMHGSLELVRSA